MVLLLAMHSNESQKTPWTPLHAQIHRTLRQRSLLQPNQRVLVAVSGGQDSLCLAKLLLDLQPKWGWQLAIAHCNHRWRSDSTANAEYVEQLAIAWQVPSYSQAVEDSLLKTVQSEAGARIWRYQALTAIAQQHNFSGIVTGHTASDRAETLLYNLMRGSGTDGLQALTWQRQLSHQLNLVRPLLGITRSVTAQFCQEFQLKPWNDTTNDNLKYARNRIRQEVLPYLQTHFNPQVEIALAQTAELLTAEVAYLENETDRLYQQAVLKDEGEEIKEEGGGMKREELQQASLDSQLLALSATGVNREVLRSAPLALQRRVVRRFLQHRLPQAPAFEQIEKVVALIEAPNRSQTDPFPGGTIAQVNGSWIHLIQPN
jgi:tRNA(Ile)-lysidine synthase